MRANMSATGSVNLIVCFSLPVRPGEPGNLRQITYFRPSSLVTGPSLLHLRGTKDERRITSLPRRLRNPRNLAPQRQSPEAKTANTELPEVGARTPANLAAIMLARRKFRLLRVHYSFCCCSHFSF